MNTAPYGYADTSFQHAGGEAGIAALCRRFYEVMDTDKRAATVRTMHQQPLDPMADRLAAFLCGWLGGPPRYTERFGSLSIPRYHQKFDIGEAERDEWLMCMRIAVDEQDWREDFKDYLMTQLAIPAERCRTR